MYRELLEIVSQGMCLLQLAEALIYMMVFQDGKYILIEKAY